MGLAVGLTVGRAEDARYTSGGILAGMRRLLTAVGRPVIGLMLLVLGLTACPGQSDGPVASGAALDAERFASAITENSSVVLDVRTPQEFASGHLKDAINIDVEAADFATKTAALDKSKSYAIYCRSGNRSGVAMKQLQAAGFTHVYHLAGGIGAWQKAGKTVVK